MSALAAALTHHQAGRLAEAETIYRKVLATEPQNIDALHLLGVLARQARNPKAAVDLIGQAIAINAEVADFHNNLGTALLDTGAIDDAQKAFMRALKLRPRYVDAMLNLANVLVRSGNDEEAVTCYRAVLMLDPKQADAASNLGVALRRLGRLDEAVDSYQLAARLQPGHANAQFNLGNALAALGRSTEAIDAYGQAIASRPDHAEAHYNLAGAYGADDRFAEAEASLCRAIELAPGYVEAHNNLGRLLQSLGRHEEALAALDAALALAPEHGDIHYNRALLLLLTGRHEEGWAEHEWRWRAAGFPSPKRNFDAPIWDGAPLPGKTLLLHAEQGLGDTIQFIRYAAAARKLVGRVVLDAPQPLHPVLKDVAGVDEFIASGHKLPPVDAQVPLLTLPRLLGEAAALPAPYLTAEDARIERWEKRLAGAGPKVGLVWGGNPKHSNDRNRSLPFALLKPLVGAGGARFFSLQLGPAAAQLDGMEGVTDLSSALADFAETAAALSCLDLLISVDTSVAHLAGALGRPVWLLLPFAPDWRWGVGSGETRWYPQMRLFRQATIGAWKEVIELVASELTTLDHG